MTAGSYPRSVDELNTKIGTTLQQFVGVRETVARHQTWLVQGTTDLKIAPYMMTAADEANIKTAIAGLNTALQAVDMTFINRLVGP